MQEHGIHSFFKSGNYVQHISNILLAWHRSILHQMMGMLHQGWIVFFAILCVVNFIHDYSTDITWCEIDATAVHWEYVRDMQFGVVVFQRHLS